MLQIKSIKKYVERLPQPIKTLFLGSTLLLVLSFLALLILPIRYDDFAVIFLLITIILFYLLLQLSVLAFLRIPKPIKNLFVLVVLVITFLFAYLTTRAFDTLYSSIKTAYFLHSQLSQYTNIGKYAYESHGGYDDFFHILRPVTNLKHTYLYYFELDVDFINPEQQAFEFVRLLDYNFFESKNGTLIQSARSTKGTFTPLIIALIGNGLAIEKDSYCVNYDDTLNLSDSAVENYLGLENISSIHGALKNHDLIIDKLTQIPTISSKSEASETNGILLKDYCDGIDGMLFNVRTR